MQSRLFGRFLVSLPYVNSVGIDEVHDDLSGPLVDRAVHLADELNCRHLELRYERHREHPALTGELTSKSHMRLTLPETVGQLWNGLKAKVCKQNNRGFSVTSDRRDLLADFYAVFHSQHSGFGNSGLWNTTVQQHPAVDHFRRCTKELRSSSVLNRRPLHRQD